jgi:hypothetical protein
MSEEIKFWTTFILALIGALAWIPEIIKYFKKMSLEGKIISRYNNLTADKQQTFFLYKLSILFVNKPFNLKQIRCEMVDKDGNTYKSTARNLRKLVFGFENDFFECAANGNEYLNNYSIFLSDINVSGYLFFSFHENLDRPLESTKFIFESFEGKILSLVFKEKDIRGDELWFDENLWIKLNKDKVNMLAKRV